MPASHSDDPTGFGQWMSAGLKQRYEGVLSEALPGELAALLDDAEPPGPANI